MSEFDDSGIVRAQGRLRERLRDHMITCGRSIASRWGVEMAAQGVLDACADEFHACGDTRRADAYARWRAEFRRRVQDAQAEGLRVRSMLLALRRDGVTVSDAELNRYNGA